MNASRSIYWDTNIFIMLREQRGVLHDLLWEILGAARGRALPFSTSALTFSELKVKPLQQRNLEILQTYEDWSSSGQWMDIWPITLPVLDGAALLRATRAGLKLPDAIHLATALHIRSRYFLTADMGLRDIAELEHPTKGKLDISPLTILRPDEPTLASILKSLAE